MYIRANSFSFMPSNSRLLNIFSIVFALIVLVLTVIYKIKKHTLFYYQDDIFTVLQTTKSWLFGHSLLWDNRYGHVEKIHFSFTALLLAPFTVLAGCKGLFYAHALIYFIVFVVLIYSDRLKLSYKERILTGIMFLLGPYAFYVFDDEEFGWHLEFLFVPLCFFFTLALIGKKNWQILFWAVLICFTKEDGPVIACCIHLIWWFLQNPFHNWKQAFRICAAWSMAFLLIMFFLKASNNFQVIRFEDALSGFWYDTTVDKGNYFLKLFGELLLLLFPIVVFLALLVPVKRILQLLLCLLPVLAVCMVSGIYYYPNTNYSFSWAPRFTEILSFLFCGSILVMHFQAEKAMHKAIYLVAVLVFCFAFQPFALGKTRNYFLHSEIRAAFSNQLPGYVKPGAAYLIKCIAKQVPAGYSVAVPHYYFNLFEHCNCFSFDHLENAPANLQLIILKDTSQFFEYKFKYTQYNIEKKRNLYILQLKGHEISLDTCK